MQLSADFVVLSSATAFIDPAVQLHAAGCSHVERRLSESPGEWEVVPCSSEAQALGVARAACVRLRIGADWFSWMDCALAVGGPVES